MNKVRATAPLTILFPERIMEYGGYALGVDIGGTKMIAGLITAEGEILQTWRRPTPTHDVMDGLIGLLDEAYAGLKPMDKEMLVGIGISTAGQVDWYSGTIEHCTPNLTNWAGTKVKQILSERYHCPVCVDNDGNAAAYGEYWCGSGRNVPNLVVLTIGTGIGGGIILNGQVIRGSRGGGGELGHTIIERNGRPCNCGQNGCLEAYASGKAIEARAKEYTHWHGTGDSREVFMAARNGDAIAKKLIEEMCDGLAHGIINIINFTDPDLILLGGGIAATSDLWLSQLRQKVLAHYSQRKWNPETIQLAQLGEHAGMIGAAGELLNRYGYSNGLSSGFGG